MDRLIHTPEGVRDVYNQECTKKLYLENQIEQVFHAFGYQDIETPTFEFFDVFGREVGTTPSRELYKFFDRDGNTLVLRPDFTPSIARAGSMYFMEETMPIRLCYRGSSFVNSSSYQGRLKESTQMGVELLNDDSAMADAEIIAMTVKVMLDAGLTDFQISYTIVYDTNPETGGEPGTVVGTSIAPGSPVGPRTAAEVDTVTVTIKGASEEPFYG